MASSSSSTVMAHPGCSYDVFLSFRGEDTRLSFTDHLYHMLIQAGISTFRDNEEIDRGEELKPEIERAIKASRASIVVLSENYATSTWCLDELLLILEQRRECDHFVLPVFYHVKPTDVRNHRNNFAIKVKTSSRWTAHNVNLWKTALIQIADLKGLESSGPETSLLKEIVDTVYNKLDRKEVHLPLNMTGMTTRYKEISFWLDKCNLEFLAIYGMGGSGKTTLAKYIYVSIQKSFEYVSFVEDIGSRCTGPNDLLQLQEQLLKDILGGKKRKIPGVSQGTCMIEEALQVKRTLIVLDDIVDKRQLIALLGTGKINSQSKVIITTRENTDNWFDLSWWRCQKYEMRLLNDSESLELLSRHAFGSKIPLVGFEKLVLQAVQYCEGNPLALEVLGSSMFKNNTIPNWKSQLNLLGKDIDSRIQDVLVRSYMSLPYNSEKELFLHIACFFIGKDMDYVVKILEPDYSAISGIKTLLNRCLLSVSPNKKLMMHRLLQEMGKNIVRQESLRFPQERSRVWLNSDSYRILRRKEGSKTIEGLALDMKMLQKEEFAFKSSNLETGALENMDSLKLLQLNFVALTGSFESFSENLRWLCWLGFPLRILPSDLCMRNLVAIDMSYGNLGVFAPPMVLQSLQILNLKDSHNLFEISDISKMPQLETLILWNCFSLVKVCKTIKDLKSLALLNMTGCRNLFNQEQMNLLGASTSSVVVTKQPTFSFPSSLRQLFLNDCHLECTEHLPLSFSDQPYLQYINLGNSRFKSLPCYDRLKNLQVLDLSFCSRLKCILCLPSTLAELYVYGCELLERITFESRRFTLQEFGYLGCIHLYEVEGFIKLIPIAKLDEIDLGHMKWLKEYQNHEVCLVGDDELTVGRSWHIQMLYEFDIMSTSLPDIKDLNMIPNYISESSSLSFDVPSCPQKRRLEGINVTFKYAISGDDWAWFCKVSTPNGVVDLMYNPKVFGKPEFGKVCIWLSYWPIGSTLNTGDTVNVSVVVMSGLEVHECGVSLVYSDQETVENNMGWEEILKRDFPGFKLSTGAYYLCRRDFFELMEVGKLTRDWFRILVGDILDNTEVRGWRKTGRPKQVNDPLFTELKTVRCIMDGPQLDSYKIAETSKSSFGDKTVAFTSSLPEEEITDDAIEEIYDKQYKLGNETIGDSISTFDDIIMEESDSYSDDRIMSSSMGEGEKTSSSTSAQPCRRFSRLEIIYATNNFDDKLIIGDSRYGRVYKGQITSEGVVHDVAIKRWSSSSTALELEFWAEIETLCKFHHRHLVSLVGYCDVNKEKIIVYEYVPNGPLYYHLHRVRTPLSWVARLKIAIGAARGLHYLHSGAGTQHGVIHFRLSSEHILLDENWEAVISSMGGSKIGPTDQSISHVYTAVTGTFGYLDPEVVTTGKLTWKSDVYSFGLVLFELLSGRHPQSLMLGKKGIKERNLDKLVDPTISGTISTKCLRRFTQIADRCVRRDLRERPTMSELVISLEALLELQEQPHTSAEPSSMMGFPWKIYKYFVAAFKPKSDQSGTSSKKSIDNKKNEHDE